jgi:integrase
MVDKVKAITIKQLQNFPIENLGKWFSDGSGIRYRARANHDGSLAVDFSLRYRRDRALKEVALGSWPKFGLAEIRTKAQAIKESSKTADPVTQRETARIENRAKTVKAKADAILQEKAERARFRDLLRPDDRLTVRALFELWAKLGIASRADQGAEARRAFEKDVFPALGDKAAAEVTKGDIQLITDQMKMRNVGRMVKRVFSDLRQMFTFAVERDLLQDDPTRYLKKKFLGKDAERERALSEAELIALFQKLDAPIFPKHSRIALMLQLATICRIGELLKAQWVNVDLENSEWTLPFTKNGRQHTVYLSEFAKANFKALKELTGLTPWCFPNRDLSGPIDPKTITKQVADRQRSNLIKGRAKDNQALVLTGGPWQTHDLRRTGASMMAENLGVLPEVVERCLNHTEQIKVKRIYQRAQFKGPMLEAWQKWGDRLELLQSKALNQSNNVATLTAKRAKASKDKTGGVGCLTNSGN